MDIGDPTKMPDHDVSFSDVLSVLNPLQYIPVVGSIYRAVTGDTIPQAAQVLGGALLGGPLGMIASAANAILEQSTGKDASEHVLAMFSPQSDTPAAPGSRYAANTSTTPATALSAVPAATSSTDTASPPDATTIASAAATPDAAAAQTAATPAVQPPPAAAAAESPAPAASPGTAVATAPLAGPAKAASGYSLADYRTFSGHAMPAAAGANGAQLRNAPVPLQTSIPLPGDSARATAVAAMVQMPSTAVAPAAATPAVKPQDTWVSQAMMRGLDRYRDMMRQQEEQQHQPSQPQS
jgi:hypothetical protein